MTLSVTDWVVCRNMKKLFQISFCLLFSLFIFRFLCVGNRIFSLRLFFACCLFHSFYRCLFCDKRFSSNGFINDVIDLIFFSLNQQKVLQNSLRAERSIWFEWAKGNGEIRDKNILWDFWESRKKQIVVANSGSNNTDICRFDLFAVEYFAFLPFLFATGNCNVSRELLNLLLIRN